MHLRTLIGAEALADRLGDPRLRLFDCRFDLARPDDGRRALPATSTCRAPSTQTSTATCPRRPPRPRGAIRCPRRRRSRRGCAPGA